MKKIFGLLLASLVAILFAQYYPLLIQEFPNFLLTVWKFTQEYPKESMFLGLLLLFGEVYCLCRYKN